MAENHHGRLESAIVGSTRHIQTIWYQSLNSWYVTCFYGAG